LAKHVILKISDDFYDELKKRAEEEGYSLVSEYVLEVLSRELERTPFNPRALEARIERIEKGELPPALQEAVWKLIEEALQNVQLGDVDTKELVNKIVDEVTKKVERKIVDMINPWSQKVDALHRQLGEIMERLEELESAVKKEKAERPEPELPRAEPQRPERRQEKKQRKTAIDVLKERKVNFEEDMSFARNVDKLIEKLRRSGAVVIETTRRGRIVVHPEAWEEFWERLREAGGTEDEVAEALEDERLFKLFEALREDGLIYYDAVEGWTPSPDLRRMTEGSEGL